MSKKKSLIQRLSTWLVGSEPQAPNASESIYDEAEEGYSTPSDANPINTEAEVVVQPVEDPVLRHADHIVDLRSAIAHAAATYHSTKFYNTKQVEVTHVTLFVLPTAKGYEAEACHMLPHDEVFMEQLQQEFAERLIQPTKQFALYVENAETISDGQAKAIYPWLYIAVGRPTVSDTRTTGHSALVLTALTGELWSDDKRTVQVTPEDCPCYVGRCREVRLNTGQKLSNKVAFIGVEEQPERAEALEINRYVSRSAIRIDYNTATQQYTIQRSPYITSSNHVVHLRKQDASLGKIALSPYVAEQRYTLGNGDIIEFNRRVGLSVEIIPLKARPTLH